MSLVLGPGISFGPGVTIDPVYVVPYVTAGLVLNMDAGDTDSYPGTGTTWTNLVDNAQQFTLYNGVTYSSSNGGYLTFNPASSQYVEGPSFASSLTTWTVEAWHYYAGTNNSGSPCIVTEVYTGGPINYTVGNCTDSSPDLQVGYWDGASFHPTPAGTVLTPGQWYQVVGIYNGTANQLYLNGALVSSTASASVPQSGGAGIRFMRRWDAEQYWGGNLSIVRIYDADIGSAGVTQNFNANKTRFGL